MDKALFIWITARDGSVHATRPPIYASGHPMLCGRSYRGPDLRIESQGKAGHAPTGACPVCDGRVAVSTVTDAGTVHERKAPMWP